MPAAPWVQWISDNEALLGKAAGVLAGAGYIIYGRLSKLRGGKTIETAYQAEVEKAKAKPPSAPPPPQSASAAELQAATARYMSTEAVLLETQHAIARIRAAMDKQARDAAREEGALSAALVSERAENERLRARVVELEKKGAELVAQMLRERAEPQSSPPPRKPPRGPSER